MAVGRPTLPPPAAGPADLSTCDREPIHVPGSIQPHGVLLALREPDLSVAQVSANVRGWLGRPADEVLGRPLDALFGPAKAAALRAGLANPSLDRSPLYLRTVTVQIGGGPRSFRAVAHRHDGVLILELEPTPAADPAGFQDLYPVVRGFVAGLERAPGFAEVCRLAAEEVRRLTGFDRVLVYRFDPEWNGNVVAESKDEAFNSLLGLHFPASDIPAQARDLYRLNRFRLISDASYAPVPLVPADNPATGRPLDLSYAALRSVSPIHCEYLHNLGIVASLSVSVLRDGRLWALISCHHKTPRVVPFEVRTALDLLGQLLSLQVANHEHAADMRHRIALKACQARLLAAMAAEPDFVHGLTARAADLLGFADAGGAAVLYDGRCELVGATPPEADVRRLADLIADAGRAEVFGTDAVGDQFPAAAGLADKAAGVLAVSISKLHRSFVLWFRPEVVRTVNWAGDPRKPAEPAGNGHANGARLHPRKSFELWKEAVRGKSRPWRPAELAVAADLRNDIVGIVLRKAEERAALTAELERSNKELEAFSYSVSHDLRAPFRHIVGYSELLRDRSAAKLDETDLRYLDTIGESARFAGKLVDGLLHLAQVGRAALTPTRVALGEVVGQVRRGLAAAGRDVDWVVHPLPAVQADLVMVRLAVQNLLENAVKFTRGRPAPRVEVGAEAGPGPAEATVWVRDNGVGFDMKYADKLFGVFQRLHRPDEFEGTGIGLANVRRIVGRHGGRTWAAGRLGEGATFYFTLPTADEGA